MNHMGFQNTVKAKQAAGIEGEFRDSSIRVVSPFELGATASIGTPAFLVASNGKAAPYASGTADKYLGVFVSPKEYVNNNRDLNATLEMTPDEGGAAQVASLGHVWVKVAEPVAVGDKAYYGASGWCKTPPSAGTAVTDRALGVFLDAGATGEVAGVRITVELGATGATGATGPTGG